MTVKELYEYAKWHDMLDYEIHVQYRDDGGLYSGTEVVESVLVEDSQKALVLQGVENDA